MVPYSGQISRGTAVSWGPNNKEIPLSPSQSVSPACQNQPSHHSHAQCFCHVLHRWPCPCPVGGWCHAVCPVEGFVLLAACFLSLCHPSVTLPPQLPAVPSTLSFCPQVALKAGQQGRMYSGSFTVYSGSFTVLTPEESTSIHAQRMLLSLWSLCNTACSPPAKCTLKHHASR